MFFGFWISHNRASAASAGSQLTLTVGVERAGSNP